MLVRFASYVLPLLLLAACSSQPSKVDVPAEDLVAPVVEEQPADAPADVADETENDDIKPDLKNLYKRGLTLMKAERYKQALDLWTYASENHTEYPGVWVNLALAQYHQEQYKEGKISLEKALEIDESFCPAHKTLGLIEKELGDFKASENSYIAAIECDPEDGNTRRNLGILYDLYLHDVSRALEQYQAAKRLYFAKDKNLEIWIANLTSRLPAPEVATPPPAEAVADEPVPDGEQQQPSMPQDESQTPEQTTEAGSL